MEPRLPGGWMLLVVVAIATSTAHLWLPGGAPAAMVAFAVPVVAALVLTSAGLRRVWRTRRAPWLALTAAVVLFAASQALLLLTWDSDFPVVAGTVGLVAYVPLALTSVLIVRGGSRTSWLDVGVVSLAPAVLVWVQLVEPVLRRERGELMPLAFTVAYPVVGLLMAVVLLRMVLYRGARTPASVTFTVGALLMVASNVGFAWIDLHGVYAGGATADVAWVWGLVIAAASPLMPGASAEPHPVPETFGLERGRIAVVLAGCVAVLASLALEVASHGLLTDARFAVVLGATVLCIGLVGVRLWGLMGRARRVALRHGEERLAAVINHSRDAIMLAGDDDRIAFASPAAGALWQTDPEHLAGSTVGELVAEASRDDVQRAFAAARATPDAVVSLEAYAPDAGGNPRFVEGTVANLTDHPSVGALVVTLRDVTRRREMEDELSRRAFHDDLTGLPNRALFNDRVQHAIDGWARKGEPATAVVFIDLDDFKSVNDGIGHGAGDVLLRETAGRLQACVRRGDSVARLGGDEFALLLEDLADQESAVVQAERTLERLREPLQIVDVVITPQASAGIAFVGAGSTVESLLRDADIAMYEAKRAGKNRISMFDDRLLDVAHRRLDLKVALPQALIERQFSLAYQPIKDATLGHLRGFEALIRWEHPELGAISPAEIIPNAEESGLIVDIGRWVLDEACRQTAVWNAASPQPLSVNVNVSAVQLRHPSFVGDVVRTLHAHDLDPALLVLEITESVLAESAQCRDALQQLRATGVGLAIDDFGTGYSSLAYLHRMPVTCVKIDRAFIAELDQGTDSSLTHSVLMLAQSLGLDTVAEGVETQEQMEVLAQLNCGLVQGYHILRPQPPEEIDRIVAELGMAAREA